MFLPAQFLKLILELTGPLLPFFLSYHPLAHQVMHCAEIQGFIEGKQWVIHVFLSQVLFLLLILDGEIERPS